jgi:hypothetical protein
MGPSHRSRDGHRRAWWAVLIAALTACSRGRSSEPAADDELGAVPQGVAVPPADGPKLVALTDGLAVLDRPSHKGKPLGLLRIGGRVARAAVPYSARGCPGGWYPVRPRGFVCAGDSATVNLDVPIARVLEHAGPALDRALPYRYGRVAGGTGVVYYVLPTPEQQLAAEPRLPRRTTVAAVDAGTGANDVPLDEAGLGLGPPVLRSDSEGVGEDGRRTTESFFMWAGPLAAPAELVAGVGLVSPPPTPNGGAPVAGAGVGDPVASRVAPSDPARAGGDADDDEGAASRPGAPPHEVLRRRSGVALARSFVVGEGERARRFGMLPDGRFIAVDRLLPALGTSWHGVALAEAGLPIAFALRSGVRYWTFDKKGDPKALDDELDRGEVVWLSGRFRSVQGLRYYASRDERWIRHRDVILIPKRHKFPELATGEQRWLDVSLANQTLVAWQGRQAVYATLVSSGRDRLGDPQTTASTPQGIFRVRAKHVTRAVDERETQGSFSVIEAPWVLELDGGFHIVGSYWQRDFGEAQGHHDLALAPIDARWIFGFAEPGVPEGWHAVTLDDAQAAAGLAVYVHR